MTTMHRSGGSPRGHLSVSRELPPGHLHLPSPVFSPASRNAASTGFPLFIPEERSQTVTKSLRGVGVGELVEGRDEGEVRELAKLGIGPLGEPPLRRMVVMSDGAAEGEHVAAARHTLVRARDQAAAPEVSACAAVALSPASAARPGGAAEAQRLPMMLREDLANAARSRSGSSDHRPARPATRSSTSCASCRGCTGCRTTGSPGRRRSSCTGRTTCRPRG